MSKKERNPVTNTDSVQLNINTDAEIVEIPAQRNNKRRFIFAVCVIMAWIVSCVLMVSTAFSWFSPGQVADLSLKATDFSTLTHYSISGSNYKELGSNVNISVASLNSLKLRIVYNGYSSAYLRIRLFESFKDESGKVISTPSVSYELKDNWKKYGDYYYCEDVVGLSKTLPVNVDFINKATLAEGSNVPNNSYFNLVAVVEAVQPDRFDEFFGVSYNTVFGISDTTQETN